MWLVQEWGSCKGSRENSRGFTCGLWLLLHSLAARATPEATGGAFWMTAVRCDPALTRHHDFAGLFWAVFFPRAMLCMLAAPANE